MRIDWSGARVLTTLIIAVIGFALGLSADGLMAIVLGAVLGFGAWWIFPKIVKEA